MDKTKNKFVPNNKIYIIIIGCLIGVLFWYDHKLEAALLLIIYILLIIYNVRKYKQREAQWDGFVNNFSSRMDIASNGSFMSLPFPLVMVNFKGSILWYNKNFSHLIDDKNLLGQNVKEINKELSTKSALEGRKTSFSDINIGSKYFDVTSTVIYQGANKNSNEAVTLYYFYDVTMTHHMKVCLEENKYSIMLIEVDNLNEVLKNTDEDKAPLLAADIERNINSYAQNLNAMIKKYNTNKYVLTIQDKLIQDEMNNKFNILDIIREIDYGNKLTVTLSVGVGRGGTTPQENYDFAESAKDLALGRGGDQVVVKNRENLLFFGGRSKEVEKKTKVKARVIAHVLLDLIKESDKVLIMGHKNIDVDCLGAAIGIHSAINQIGIESHVILNSLDSRIKEIKEGLMKEDHYKHAFIDKDLAMDMVDKKTLLIIVDVHNEGHVECMDLVKKCDRVVVIDHHRKAPDYIQDTLLSYIETYASSTSELVTEMLPYLVDKISLKKLEATTMLAGIYLDTKNFYFKTGVRTFEAASVLRNLGADTIFVKKMFKEDFDKYIMKSDIIKSSTINNRIAIAICPDDVEDTVVAAQVADELLNITDIDAAFVLIKLKDSVYISGRSLDKVNVQVILEELGGGGHMVMAAAKLKNTDMISANKLLKNSIEKYLREGE